LDAVIQRRRWKTDVGGYPEEVINYNIEKKAQTTRSGLIVYAEVSIN